MIFVWQQLKFGGCVDTKSVDIVQSGFFSWGDWGSPPSSENFVNPPPSDTCPRFWTKACPPQPRFNPDNLKNLNTFFVLNLTTFKLKSTLTGGNWQKWKRVFLTCPCHEIYKDEAVDLKSCKNTWKITIFVKMWNLGQYRENLIFWQ